MDAKYLGAMPASPVVDTLRSEHGDTYTEVCYGLTKREAFAMAAMQGLVARSTVNALLDEPCLGHWADVAVKQADALLAELAKEQP